MPNKFWWRRALVIGVLLMIVLSVGWLRSAFAARTLDCTADTPAADRPLLRQGDVGTCVTVLQEALAAAGHPTAVDGTYAAQTEQAVRRFQSAWLGVTVDGIVGPVTWKALVEGGVPPYSLQRGPNPTPRVVLSFDDCPRSLAAFRQTVQDAQALGIALVIFSTGDCVKSGRIDPDDARARGHYVFNHSATHARLTDLGHDEVLAELGPPGIQTSYGRPPYGSYDTPTVRDAYAARGMRIWTWTLDTRDWDERSQDQVVDTVVTKATEGGTVLMHLQHAAFNGSALAAMKDGLAARGLGVCTNRGPTAERPEVLDC